MQTFNPHEFIDYGKNDPAYMQGVYFGIPDAEYKHFLTLAVKAISRLVAVGEDNPGVIQAVMLDAITTEYPHLTIPQMIAVVHLIAHQSGIHRGIEMAIEFQTEPMVQYEQPRRGSKPRKPQATA